MSNELTPEEIQARLIGRSAVENAFGKDSVKVLEGDGVRAGRRRRLPPRLLGHPARLGRTPRRCARMAVITANGRRELFRAERTTESADNPDGLIKVRRTRLLAINRQGRLQVPGKTRTHGMLARQEASRNSSAANGPLHLSPSLSQRLKGGPTAIGAKVGR